MSFLLLPADGSVCVVELKEENVGGDVVGFLKEHFIDTNSFIKNCQQEWKMH